MVESLHTVGKAEIRKDAFEKVIGAACYAADIKLENTLWVSVLRSDRHAARLVNIDTSDAESLPGVVRIITGKDIPGAKSFGALVQDQVPLVQDEVRFFGEPVALIVADTRQHAEEALLKIRVAYEDLDPIFETEKAIKSEARKIHPGGNLLTEYDVQDGDVSIGFQAADVVIEGTFRVPRISPGYMEPENSLARWNQDGSITVWVNSQQPFHDQEQIASVLGCSVDQIQVISAVIGGAFGGKEDASISILAALAAFHVHGTVRICNDRKDSFLAHPKRHPAKLTLKIGATREGKLTALDASVIMDTGAYASYGPAVGSLLTEVVEGPYRIPNVHVHTKVVYTNSPISGAMRGFGAPQANFATESLINMLADKLDLDPLELRQRNILKAGDAVYTKVVVNETAKSLPIILDKIADYRQKYAAIAPRPGKISGVGFACASQTMGLGAKVPDQSSHRLIWNSDGTVTLYLGSPDLGQGLAVVAEQMIAERLGLPFEKIQTAQLDTFVSPDGNVTCASRMTYMVGNAVIAGADQLIKQVIEQAGTYLRVDPAELKYARGNIILVDGTRVSVQEILARTAENEKPIEVTSTAAFPYPIETTPQHLPVGMPHVKYVFAGHVVRVEIDPELGSVEVTHLAAIHDVGQVINRLGVEGQIEGGVAMGLGYALHENMLLKPNGEWMSSFTEYLLPTIEEMPDHLEIEILEVAEPGGPYGAKGLAEICLVPTGAAVANAVFNATQKRIFHLPIQSEDLL